MDSNILILLVVAVSVQLSAAQNQQDVCRGVPDNNFVANPDDCSAFYICVDGIGRVEKCPPGTQFDYLKGYCSFDDDVACKSVEETTEAASESTESESMTTTAETLTTVVSTSTPSVVTTEKEITQTTETTETTTVASSTAEEFCRTVDPNTLKFVPSATSCEQYFICMNGKPLQLHCASGSHWNNEMQFCDDPKRANCQLNSPVDGDPKCPPHGSAFFPHPKICEFFLSCEQGKITLQRCPFYYQWDTHKETCVMKHLVKCDKSTVSQYRWI